MYLSVEQFIGSCHRND